MKERETLLFSITADWEAWLEAEGSTCVGIWLKIAKKGASTPTISYAQALDLALCFGWIDGQKRPFDDQYWLQGFGPRTKTSIWSQVNRLKIEALIAQGLVRPAGLAAVELARANGRWDSAYQGLKGREIPLELEELLSKSPSARTFFDALDSQNRFAFVFRIQTLKTPAKRQEKAQAFVAMMEEGKTFYPRRQKRHVEGQ